MFSLTGFIACVFNGLLPQGVELAGDQHVQQVRVHGVSAGDRLLLWRRRGCIWCVQCVQYENAMA